MLSVVQSKLSDTVAVEITGKPEKEDVVKLKEIVEERFGAEEKFNVYLIAKDLDSPTVQGITERLKFLAKRYERVNKAAIVSDVEWVETIQNLTAVIPDTEAKHFGLSEHEEAWNWLRQ